MAYQVSNIRHLTVDDLPNIPRAYYDIADFSEADNDSLKDEDYVLATLTCPNGSQYTILHGFPGDNADGIIYDNTLYILANIGESCDDVNDLTHWYISLGDTANEIFCNELLDKK